ncbi:MAG: translation initiation factor IF-2 [Clostridia bacterium]|nr:translation initiation factor IF-2 [Clostridia bacterium]
MEFREIKINDLSKELNIPSKTLIEKCNEIGIEAKNFMKVLSADEVKKLCSYVNMGGDKPAESSQPKAQAPVNKAPAAKPQQPKPVHSQDGDDQGAKRHRPSNRGEYTQITTPQKKTRDVKPGSEVRSDRERNNDNRPQGQGQQRPYNRDRDGQNGGFNRDGQQRPYNRDRDGQNGGYNRDGQQRPYNRDRDGQGGGYNRDGQQRPYNRDGQGGGFNRDGQRPFNKDGQKPYGNKPQFDRPKNDNYSPFADKDSDDDYKTKGKSPAKPKPKKPAEGFMPAKPNARRDSSKDSAKSGAKDQNKERERSRNLSNDARFDKNRMLNYSGSEIEDLDMDNFFTGGKTYKAPKKEKYIPPKAVLTKITIADTISVKELAEALKKTSADVIKRLMLMGSVVSVNQEIDFDTASLIAMEYGVTVEKAQIVTAEDILFNDEEPEDDSNMVARPPVVVVMGHVDHGKTSLLDAIRSTSVTTGEAGGITQHIGASVVQVNGRTVTFLDTPGHEAFTSMRLRGAMVTDIAILVVAADDGVMPQTVEAINHARAANVTIVVAINKIDKPTADPDRVKRELANYGVVSEEWGGDITMIPVSAKTGEGINDLLELMLLTADMQELKADPTAQAKGTVIEARLDKNKGAVATMLVQRGTLKSGDSIVSGTTMGRIRVMTDDKGKRIKEAGPSTPVEILGLAEIPEAGELFYVIDDEKVARQLVERRKEEKQQEAYRKSMPTVSLDALFNQIQAGEMKELNLIVKADVQGSVEAVKQSLEKISNDEVKVKVIHGAVGAVNESDVNLAKLSNAIIIGFNVRPGLNVMDVAKENGVDVRLYRVIYQAIDDVEAAMKGLLAPTFQEVIHGHAEVRQLFKISGVGTIGGCMVKDGKIVRNCEVRLVRDGIVVYEGKMETLRRFKDDVKEVAAGYECGIQLEKFNDVKEGDIIEAFTMEEVAR